MLCAAEPGERRLEFRHLWPQDELAMRQHAIDPPAQLGCDARLLRLEVDERNGGHGRFTTGISPSLLCSNSGTSRPSRVSARRACPPRQAPAISSIARPTIAGSAVRGDAIKRPAKLVGAGGSLPWNSSS